ncbi:pseudouridine synthase domain protein [Burkholderia sp. ABCPW 111]|nr:pseudouridine synthase domain protein [Burkholderia sp. ABCPW 111]
MLRLGRSGEYRIQPDFPAWGVPSLVLTSPSSALLRNHIGRTPFYSQQGAAPG